MESKSRAQSSEAIRVGDKAILHVHFQEEQKKKKSQTTAAQPPPPASAALAPSLPTAPTSPQTLLPARTQNALNWRLLLEQQQKVDGSCHDEKILEKANIAFLSPPRHHHDVIFGRGKINPYFSNLVKSLKSEYVATPKEIKNFFATEVVNQIRSLNPPRRFLRKDEDAGVYSEVSNKKALKKTSQALRENNPKIKKKIESGQIIVEKEITYGNIPEIVHRKAKEAYAKTFPHSISTNGSKGGQGPVYAGRLALGSSSASSSRNMNSYGDSSTSRCYHEVINYDAHVKKPDQSLLFLTPPAKEDTSSTSSTSDIPSLSATSNAHTSTSAYSYAALSSSNRQGRADCPYHAVLGIDSVPATEFTTGGAGVTEQRRAGYYDGSRSNSQSSLPSSNESASFNNSELFLLDDPYNISTIEALKDGD